MSVKNKIKEIKGTTKKRMMNDEIIIMNHNEWWNNQVRMNTKLNEQKKKEQLYFRLYQLKFRRKDYIRKTILKNTLVKQSMLGK